MSLGKLSGLCGDWAETSGVLVTLVGLTESVALVVHVPVVLRTSCCVGRGQLEGTRTGGARVGSRTAALVTQLEIVWDQGYGSGRAKGGVGRTARPGQGHPKFQMPCGQGHP